MANQRAAKHIILIRARHTLWSMFLPGFATTGPADKRESQDTSATTTPSFHRYFVPLSLILALATRLVAYDTPTQDYEVRSGDTLYSLARRYGVSVNEIMSVNELENSSELKLGMLLKIPAKKFSGRGKRSEESIKSGYSIHTVAPGETYYAIARKYFMSTDELLELNGLSANGMLKQGQKIVVKALAEESRPKKPRHNVSAQNSGISNDVAKEDYYWPASGRREALSGKVEGVRIMARDQSLVYSVRDGRVLWQGPYRSYGSVTLVASEDGYIYLYGGNVHFLVNTGQEIRKGEPLGKVDSEVGNQLAGQSQIYQGHNKQLAKAKKYPSQVYFSVFRNGEFVPAPNAPRS